MNLVALIRELGRGATGAGDLSRQQACELYGAMLDGQLPALELGAIVIALRLKGETDDELLGFLAATRERLHPLRRPRVRYRPLVIPTYNGARRGANLTPLLALLLQRQGIPVLLHGSGDAHGRVTSEEILREFGVPPSDTPDQAQRALDEGRIAYLRLSQLAPGLDQQLALRTRLGLRNTAHTLAKLVDPFDGEAILLAAATHPHYLDAMRRILLATNQRALLLRATEGEPYANPRRQPRVEYLHGGRCEIVCEAEHDSVHSLPLLPAGNDAGGTAAWMREVLAGDKPLPNPIRTQIAACLGAADGLLCAR